VVVGDGLTLGVRSARVRGLLRQKQAGFDHKVTRAAQGNPTEGSEAGWINQPQQDLPRRQGLGQLIGPALLQAVKVLGQTKGQQCLPLQTMAQGLPTAAAGVGLEGFETEVGGQVPVAGIAQQVTAGPLVAVGDQGAFSA
jgi:hypothetical protein